VKYSHDVQAATVYSMALCDEHYLCFIYANAPWVGNLRLLSSPSDVGFFSVQLNRMGFFGVFQPKLPIAIDDDDNTDLVPPSAALPVSPKSVIATKKSRF
jgi:hypothetical protein